MPHPREAMIDTMVAMLLNKTAAGTRVLESLTPPWRPNQLPAIAIYDPSESVREESAKSAPRELERSPLIAVDCALKATDAFVTGLGGNLNKALNRMADQVERALNIDDTLAGNISDMWLADTEKTLLHSGDQMIGVITLTYRVKYFRFAPLAEDVPLDDFDTADIRYSLSDAVHPDNQAHDLLENLYAVP